MASALRAQHRGSIMLRRQALYRVEVSWRALAAAPRGSRNSELNRSAFRCGRVIGAGWLHRAEAGKALVGASISNGLMRDDGLPSVRATITSGLDAGLRASPHQPRRFRARSLARPLTEHEADDQNQKIQGLWRRGGCVEGTIAETYLRQARAYAGPIPRTFRFLPPSGSYPPSLMAPFGLPGEAEPSVLEIDEHQIAALQLTRLLPDGSDRIRDGAGKITIGRGSSGYPIVVAPLNDRLGLTITQGAED